MCRSRSTSTARLEKLVPEDWKEWQYQFGVATHAYSSKHGALLEIVERLELDEVSTETLKNQMTQEQMEWMERTQSEIFSVLSLLTKGEENQLVMSCNDKNGYTACKKSTTVQPEDAGELDSSMVRCHQTQEDQGHA